MKPGKDSSDRDLSGAGVIAAGHVTEVYGPVQALQAYLRERGGEFTFITLPFSFSSIPAAEAVDYDGGREVAKRRGHANRGPALWLYLRDFLFVLGELRRARGAGLFIGIDNLNSLAGIVARWLGWVRRVAYYVIDYTPRRFANPLLNYFYHLVDRICVKRADRVWNLSARMAEVRRGQGVPEERNMVVPVGVKLDETRTVKEEEVKRHCLVLMSHLTESKGVQLAIEAMGEIVAKEPRAGLEIIGTGPYADELKKQAESLQEKGAVRFLGPMTHEELFAYLPTCGIALAPYVQDRDSISYYADPTKPKEYLACSLPVIITRLPWTAEVIEEKEMGVVIDYRKEELVEACLRLLGDDDFFWGCRRRAREYAEGLDWQAIYDKALEQTVRQG